MAKRILLTGAGFTKNWGGYLAREVWERLLCHQFVRNEPRARRYLLDSPNDYETAIELAGIDKVDEEKLLREALYSILDEQEAAMHKLVAVESRDLYVEFLESFRDEEKTSLLFTLNNDRFMERSYKRDLIVPGVNPPPEGRRFSFDETQRAEVKKGYANYIKLHGDLYWIGSYGGEMVVAGGDKLGQISTYPILQNYLDIFKQACLQPDVCVVTIGYAFMDRHINDAICAGIRQGTLSTMIVNTAPPSMLRASLMGEHRLIWDAMVGYCSLSMVELFRDRGHPALSALVPGWKKRR